MSLFELKKKVTLIQPVNSALSQITESIQSVNISFTHSKFKYIILILIVFMGLRSCDHDGKGTKASEGIEEGVHVGLQAVDTEIHSRRGRSSQGPDPPALSDLP